MSDIKPGDLAVVVSPTRCCGKGKVGYVGRVVSVSSARARCFHCGYEAHALDVQWETGKHTSASRVKRIPPLSELEGEKNKEELTA